VPASDVERGLETLRALHAATWRDRSGFLPSFSRFAAAARLGVARGELVLHELVVDDVVVASDAVFDLAGRISAYQGGRSPDPRWRGAGSVLMTAEIEDACREGKIEYDLLRGDAPYKRTFAPYERRLLHLRGGQGFAGSTIAATTVMAERVRRRMGRIRRRARRMIPKR
jgi:CelD/BcsL family acetyltransferase involved in cellulose biosynthesis